MEQQYRETVTEEYIDGLIVKRTTIKDPVNSDVESIKIETAKYIKDALMRGEFNVYE